MQSAGVEGEKDVHRLFTQPVLTSHRSILMLEIAIVAQLVAKDKAKGNYCACFVERALPVIPANLHVRFLVPSHEHLSSLWPHLAAPRRTWPPPRPRHPSAPPTASPRCFRILLARSHVQISSPLGDGKGGPVGISKSPLSTSRHQRAPPPS